MPKSRFFVFCVSRKVFEGCLWNLEALLWGCLTTVVKPIVEERKEQTHDKVQVLALLRFQKICCGVVKTNC